MANLRFNLNVHMNKAVNKILALEKRVFQRIPVRMEFSCCNIECFGTIMNLSASGMYITSKKIYFPIESQFEISIPYKDKFISVDAKINRITKTNGYYDGIGIELMNPSQEYLDFINRLVV